MRLPGLFLIHTTTLWNYDGKQTEHLGSEKPCKRKYVTEHGIWDFITWPHFLFSLCFLCVGNMINQIPDPAPAMPFLHVFTTMDSTPLQMWARTTCFSFKLFFLGVFYHSHRRKKLRQILEVSDYGISKGIPGTESSRDRKRDRKMWRARDNNRVTFPVGPPSLPENQNYSRGTKTLLIMIIRF